MRKHSNQDVPSHTQNGMPLSEHFILKEKRVMRTKIDWRSFSKKEPFTAKAKKEFDEMRRNANEHFKNETVVKYKAY